MARGAPGLCSVVLVTFVAVLGSALLATPSRTLASATLFDQKCAACHPPSVTGPTCAGCHSHGVHGTEARNEINLRGTTNKTSYAAGEAVTVTLDGGNQSGWLRTLLVDQNGVELGRTTGPSGMGGGPALPVTLSGPAPAATGMYTWQVRWFGNQYDAGAATFGRPGEWIPSWEPGHGAQVGYTNPFFVGSVPKLALAPAALDFGAANVGANESLTTTLRSVGNASLTVSAIGRCAGTSAAFTTTPAAPFTIAAGSSQVLTVRYAPTAAASDTGCIAITSNDLYAPVTDLAVAGVASTTPQPTVALSPNPVDFGGVAVNTSAQRTFTVTNTGTGPLTVSGIAVTSGTSPVYTWSPAAPFTVVAGAAQAVTLTYGPRWEWVDDTTLTVTSNAVNTPSASIAVQATGYIAPVQSCTSCHGDAARTPATISSAPPRDMAGNTLPAFAGVGAHLSHLTSTRITGAPGACTDCHASPTDPHPSGVTEYSWSPLARAGGLSPSYDPVTNTCASTYCHGATLLGGANTRPKWNQLDGTQAACGTCHANPPPSPAHNGFTASTPCGNCHTGYTATTVNAGLHVNGVVDATNMTCTSCHGTAGRAGGTGESGANPVASAPPLDVSSSSATTSRGVGAHLAHLTGTRLSASPVACAECHVVPTVANHSNGASDLAWGTLTRTGGLSPSFNTSTFTCSNTWCHGGTPALLGGTNTAPRWTQVDGTQAACGTCHGNPPPAPHVQNNACSACHTGYTQTVVNATQHLNGVIDFTPQSCTTCHGAAGRAANPGITGSVDANLASAPPVDSAGSTTGIRVGDHLSHVNPAATGQLFRPLTCTDCHPNNAGNTAHANAVQDVTMATIATVAGSVVRSAGTTPATCTTYCHGAKWPTGDAHKGARTSWAWNGANAACGDCHAYPPSNAGHGGVTSTTNCGNCHSGYTATTVNVALHINGAADVVTQTCTTCHGTAGRVANTGITGSVDANLAAAPPVDAARSATGIRVGDHLSHVNPAAAGQLFRPLTCTDCHPNNAGNTAHSNSVQDVTMATIATVAASVVRSAGTTPATCTTYCHGAKWPTGDAHRGARTSWAWNGANAACGDCHAYPPTSSGHGGVTSTTNCGNCHSGYTATTVNVALHINGAADVVTQTCTSCHGTAGRAGGTGASGTNPVAAAPPVDTLLNTATTARGVGAHVSHLTGTRFAASPQPCSACHVVPTTTTHSNGTRDLTFGTLARTGGLAPAFNTTAFTCSNTWCHGNTPSLLGGTVTQPNWTVVNGTQAACGTCHGRPPPAPHVQNTTCGTCHTGYTQTAVNTTTHLNGTIDVVSRTCTTCHGTAGRAGGTGATGTNPVAAAPPVDTRAGSATTARGVGAHVAHLTGTTLSTTSMLCNDCHVVPTATTHANGTAANPNGAVLFSARTTAAGTTAVPAWNATALTCANTYCHGSAARGGTNKTPSWTTVDGTQAACGTCHGVPPAAPHVQNSTCGNCHSGYTSTAVNRTLHLNFAVNQTTTCTSCHGTANRVANSGVGTVDSNLASAPPVDAAGSSSSVKVGNHLVHSNPTAGAQLFRPLLCTDCHPDNAGNQAHRNGVLDVTLATIATFPGSVVKSVGTTPATCTTYCHGSKWPTGDAHKGARASWAWNGPNAACGDCHAYPPANTGHSGVTSATSCGNCHPGYTATTVNVSLHINGVPDGGGEPATAGTSCGGCHKSIFDGMVGNVAKVSKHTLGGGDVPTPGTASWTTAANLRASPNYATANCVSMCHGDHPHTLSGVTTHQNNVYLDANNRSTTASTTTRSARDYDSAQSSGGLCTSCHRLAVAAGRQLVGTAFTGTAHQYTSKTVGTVTYTWQYTLHDGGAFGRDCTKCHASQAEGRTPTSTANSSGNVGPHSSDFGALLAGTITAGTTPANLVCYNCHGNGTTGLDASGKDLASAVSRGATTSGGSHKRINSETFHATATEAAATWNNGAFSGTRRHVNCLDCHSTHLARTGLVARGTTATSTRNQLPPSMAGATGVAYTTYPALPTTACAANATLPNACVTQAAAANLSTSPVAATYEYQVCFKCHSSFAFGNTTFPSATGASGLQTTDAAAEFSPTSRSGHPVVTGLGAYTGNTAPKALVAAQLQTPWNVNVGTQTMLCTDCHNSDAASPAAQGPHGSAITFMLSGTNKAWPYTVAGANSGTLFRVATSETGINTVNGLFCRNCHPVMNSTGSNAVHRNSAVIGGQHGSSNNVAACTACHIRVPHGGKVSRLIVTTNAPARYKLGTPAFAQFTKNASGKDGYGTGWPAGTRSSCSQHSSATGTETW